MIDIINEDINIEIFYPVLQYYGAAAAILYGYLKSFVHRHNIQPLGTEEECYRFEISRIKIRAEAGLSIAEQIDAEYKLLGCALLDTMPRANSVVEMTLNVFYEPMARRDIMTPDYRFPDYLRS